MSSKALIWLGVLVCLFQLAIALGLFVVAYSDAFGLARIAANGEKIVEQLGQLDQRTGAQPPVSGQLRPLLQANNQAFRQLGALAGWVAGAILLTAIIQLCTLLALARRFTPRREP